MSNTYYDPTANSWSGTKGGRYTLYPVRVGVDRRTGKLLIGEPHVWQSMCVIFATGYHERVIRRWVGTFVPQLLGALETRRDVTKFYWAIVTGLDLWEPNYRIKQVFVGSRPDGTPMNSADDIRLGHFTVRHVGVYRPRAHLGDETPEMSKSIGLTSVGGGVWDPAVI